eukprot:3391244-Rhodomonas_salina.1
MAVSLAQRVIVGIDRGEPDGQRARLQAGARGGQPQVREAKRVELMTLASGFGFGLEGGGWRVRMVCRGWLGLHRCV